MSHKAKIINTYKKLKFFDQNLKPLKDKISTLTEKDEKQGKRLLMELKLVNYYITMHYYCNLNENTPVMPQEFKFKITNNLDTEFVEFATLGKKFPTLKEKDFNFYLDIYKELQNAS
jgi:hypothetical protein